MTDLTVTAANVRGLPDRLYQETNPAAVAVAAGEVVYYANGAYYLADADALASAVARGIAVNSAAAGQPLTVQTKGLVLLGSGVGSVGVTYCVSSAAGKICPDADLVAASGKFKTVLGVMQSGGYLNLDILASGQAV